MYPFYYYRWCFILGWAFFFFIYEWVGVVNYVELHVIMI